MVSMPGTATERIAWGDTRYARRQQKIVDRIAGRVMDAVEEGDNKLRVKAGRLGIFETTHTPDVYASVAHELADDGIEIEAHRFKTTEPFMPPEGIVPVDMPATHDVITVLSVGGVAVEGEPLHESGRHTRLYPPEA